MAEIKKVLITGFTGLLGSDLYKEFSSDFDVVGLSRSAESSPRSVCADITDKDKIAKIVREIRPDIIIHTAAISNVDNCELNPELAQDINVRGTENLVLVSKEIDAVLVFISTDYVFDGRKKTPYKEEDQTNPINVYGQTKLRGEEAIKSHLKKFFIIRTSWLFGKNRKNFVDTVIERARNEKAVKIVSDKFSIPTYSFDLSKAISGLIKLNKWGIYNITNLGMCSWFDWAKKILRYAQINNAKVSGISLGELNLAAKRPFMSALDTTKFSDLGVFSLRPWQEALSEYLCSKN